MYFAENEGTAKSYRDTLSPQTTPVARAYLDKAAGDKDAAIALLEKDHGKGGVFVDDIRGEILNSDKPKGHMYEVDIGAEPEHFLDWDKPVSEQPHVLDALKKMGVNTDRFDLERHTPGQIVPDIIANQVLPLGQAKDAQISEAMRAAGIPGIRYLDQGSRDAVKMKKLADDLAQYREAAKHWAATGNDAKLAIANKQIEVLEKRLKQTSNYVVFDPNLINIMRKYKRGGAP
jgi:hypothetical protein